MSLFSWGANSHGQLGLGVTTEQCTSPQRVDTWTTGCFHPASISMIAGGGGHSLILTENDLVFGCGWNSSGQLGCEHYFDVNSFSLILPLTNFRVKKFACGWDWSAGITECGELMTWGSNKYSQLGFPSWRRGTLDYPGFIRPLQRLVQVACGLRHMAAVTEHGEVLVWGSSRQKALGITIYGGEPAECIEIPTKVPDLEDVAKIACGQHHTVALTNKGHVYVWGCNKHGQLGLDPEQFPFVATPKELDMSGHPCISAHSQLVSGWTHTAIITDDGHIINWGRNCYGQLGCHKYERSALWKPQVVEGVSHVKNLAVGSEHNIALLDDGSVVSWGWNEHGNCGTGTQDIWQPQPVAPHLLDKVICIGSGYGHSFAVANC